MNASNTLKHIKIHQFKKKKKSSVLCLFRPCPTPTCGNHLAFSCTVWPFQEVLYQVTQHADSSACVSPMQELEFRPSMAWLLTFPALIPLCLSTLPFIHLPTERHLGCVKFWQLWTKLLTTFVCRFPWGHKSSTHLGQYWGLATASLSSDEHLTLRKKLPNCFSNRLRHVAHSISKLHRSSPQSGFKATVLWIWPP